MSFEEALAHAGAKSTGKRPYFLKDPDVERVMSITMAVAGEVAVMRERMDTIERLLDKNGSVTRADIEAFKPDETERAERGMWLDEYLARILRIVQQEREAIAKGAEESSEDVGTELAKG